MIARLLLAVCQVYSWLIIARVLVSWLAPGSRNELILALNRLVDPLLDLLRPLVPLPGIDLSPILALLLVRLICRLLVGWLA